MKDEIWLPVVGYEGSYSVSNYGNIWSHRSGKVLRPSSCGGRPHVILGRGNCRRIHILVAAAFLGPRPDGLEVLHTNDVPTDNRATNLRYGTRKENEGDKTINGNRKFTPEDVRSIREQRATGVFLRILAAQYGASPQHISQIARGTAYVSVE